MIYLIFGYITEQFHYVFRAGSRSDTHKSEMNSVKVNDTYLYTNVASMARATHIIIQTDKQGN